MNKLNLVGKTFYRLSVISEAYNNGNGKSMWLCKCECGNLLTITGSNLMNGTTKSCGCLQKERTSKSRYIHGCSHKTSEYSSWTNMKTRCYNNKSEDYNDYGGRGIMVCERWKNSFDNFIKDMGEKPSAQHSLDRMNVNGNYEPNNCKWSTDSEQTRNKRSNVWYEHNGMKMILQDWANYLGASQGNLWHCIKLRGYEAAFQYYLNKIKVPHTCSTINR